MTPDESVEEALRAAHRDEWGIVLAATARVARDIDLAEECVQEAYADALRRWRDTGVPRVPGAWLTTAARRRAIDALRRERTLREKFPLLVEPDGNDMVGSTDDDHVPDDRLRLMLLCCHPALPDEARTALTLRMVCGMSTADIARAFLVSESTMAARLTRAKKKIAGARIPYRLPSPEELPARTSLLLNTVYLLFTAGHVASKGEAIERPELLDEAMRLIEIVHGLRPSDPEVKGLRALMTVIAARRASRVAPDGLPLTLAEQDRSQWNHSAIAEARAITLDALRDPGAGRFALQAAIAVIHAEATDEASTDWPQILGLYDRLLEVWPTPVVRLNRCVALARADGLHDALIEVEALARDEQLRGYPYLAAVHADLLGRAGRPNEAAERFTASAAATSNSAEADALLRRANEQRQRAIQEI